jgi:hypothetical protein
MSVKISSLNTASTISSGDDINIAGNNPLYFSDWGGGWFMQDSAWIRSYNSKSLWIGAGVIGGDGGLTIGYGGTSYGTNNAIIAGLVGIGTTSPSAKLHIGESGAAAQLWLQRTDGYNPIKLIGGTLSDGNGFKITMNTTDAFAITSTGNVGIGTTSPLAKLDVETSAAGYAAIIKNTSAGGDYLKMIGDSGNTVFEFGSGGTGGEGFVNIYSDAVQKILFDANGASYFNAGNVGIGTTSPNSNLTVSGTTSLFNGASTAGAVEAGHSEIITTGFNIDAGASLDISNINVTLNKWKVIIKGGFANNYEGAGLISSSLEIEVDSNSPTIDIGSTDLTFSRNSSTGKLQVTNTNSSGFRVGFVGTIQIINYPISILPTTSKIILGKVGIGTTTPATKLQVVGGYISTKDNAAYGGAFMEGDNGVVHFGSLGTDNVSLYSSGTRLFINGTTGNIGIGTTNPSAKLQTVSSGLGDGGGIRITNTGAGGDDYRIWPTATVNGEGAGKLIFSNNGGNVLTLTSGGNVGIGTTSPSAPLTVAGTTDLAWAASTSKLQISRNSTVARLQNYENGSASTNLALQWEGGNVGIGTTSPNRTLSVNGIIGVASGTANTQQLVFNIDSGASYITSSYFGSSSYVPMYFETGGAVRLAIQTNGNIGIGTTTDAGYKLDVNGSGRFSSILTISTAISINPADYVNNVVIGNVGDSAWRAKGIGGSAAANHNWTIAHNGSNLYFGISNGVTASLVSWLVVSPSGAVEFNSLAGTGSRMVVADASGVLSTQTIPTGTVTGTGTTNYLPKFTGASALGDSQIFDNGSGVTINGTTVGEKFNVNGYIGLQNAGVQKWHFGANASNALVFSRSGVADRMVLDSDGNVGIGTTTPNRKLTIEGTSNAYMSFNATSNRNTTIGSDGVGNFVVFDDTFGDYRMAIFSDGNLAINRSTNAGYKLDVNGTARVQGQLSVNHSLSSNYGAVIYNTSATGEGLVVRGGSTASHTSFAVQPYDGSVALFSVVASGAATFSSSVTATNFIGAGTGLTGTASSLSIGGNATTATNISNTGTVTLATATEANSIYITQPSYTTDTPVKLLNFAWYSDVWQMGNIRSGGVASNGFGIYLSGSEKIRIATSGNLLIGTTTDSGYKLDVNGSGRFTNSVYSESVNAYVLNQTGNITDTKIWSIQNLPSSGQLRIRALNDNLTSGINAIVISRTDISSVSLDFNGAATFSSSVTAVGALFTSSTETRGNIRTTFTSDNSYYSLFSNDGALNLDTYGVGGFMNFKILGSTKFTIANSGAATFSNSLTTTNGYISANYNAGDVIIWGGIAPYANVYGALSWDVDKAIVKGRGGYALGLYVDNNVSKGITIATSGAATFSSSVTAGSFIKSGGTAAQFLKADGSIDSNTYATTSALAAYLSLSGGTITGDLTVNNKVYVGTHGCYFEEVLIGSTYELRVVDSAGNMTVLS